MSIENVKPGGVTLEKHILVLLKQIFKISYHLSVVGVGAKTIPYLALSM
jgi:hypothetical protein